MADLIDAGEAKRTLGCDDATLKEYINTGQLRAQSAGGKLMINANDVATLANSVESDDGTIILSEDSEDLSIDLGEVIDDSAATIVGDSASDDGGITFDESDQLEVVDFESGSDDVQLDDATGQTDGLSFTESNTAIMTSVDETIVDQTASDLQTVDYGDYDDDETPSRRASARRSVHSQRYENVPLEENIGVGWPIVLGLCAIVIAFLGGPMVILATAPTENETYEATGEKVIGTEDGYWSSLAAKLAGFSPNPDPEEHKRIYGDESEYIKMPNAPGWRYADWRGSADKEPEARLKELVIDDVELPPGERVPESARAMGKKSASDQEESTLKVYRIVEMTDDDGNVIGHTVEPSGN